MTAPLPDFPLDWTKPPLWQVEKAAVISTAAASEVARRYAEEAGKWSGDSYRRRIALAWGRGWIGESNPYEHHRGGNFARPLSRAYWEGKRKRKELEELAAKEAEP